MTARRHFLNEQFGVRGRLGPLNREATEKYLDKIEAEAVEKWQEALKALTFGMAYTDEYGDTHWPVGFAALDRARALLDASEGSDKR